MTREEPTGPGGDPAELEERAIEWIVRLRSGRATTADAAAFRAWRGRSPAHEAAARSAEALWRDVGETATAVAHASAPPVAERRRAGRRGAVSRRAVLGGAMAASVAGAIAIAGTRRALDGLFADYATTAGEQRRVRLPDGSTAFLNTASALDIDYSVRARRIILHAGEALFTVTREVERPFVAAAGPIEARALGTTYAIRRDGDDARLVVGEGAVELRLADGGGAIRVPAGHAATLTADHRLSGPHPVDVAATTAWTRGKLVFNGRPLAEVVAELERYRAGRIVILEERLKATRVSGVFDLADPAAVLRTLEQTLDVRVVEVPFLTLIH